jgi:phosphatidylserine/phosphatidylglycerophosphate/cardiolipin synthase-like enzyme
MAATPAPTAEAIDSTIQKNLPKLSKPGVLTVRPGFEIADHQLTGRSAIVATVHTKMKDLPAGSMLPDHIGNIPVDVREASAHQRLRAHDPAAAALTQAYGRPEDYEPTWPYEREMPSGKLLTDPQSDTQKALAQHMALQPATERALTQAKAKSTKTSLDYQKGAPTQNFPLTPVTTTATITAHVSPDAGFVNLQKFLAATRQSLVIGMYDFTSGPILQTFLNDLTGNKTLQMVLDHPAKNPTANQTDSDTVEKLRQQLGNRATIAWALDKPDTMATAFMFPYAYHIKVMVQDGQTFWLSSGNLNNSNQPDPASPPNTEDRDWHVIIEHEGLAKTFAAYLNYDYQSAKGYQASPSNDIAQAVAAAHDKLALDANPPPPPLKQATQGLKAPAAGNVPAQTFSNAKVTITPLLTPDKLLGTQQGEYLSNITNLIKSANKTLYIQLQYIEASSGKGDNYDNLLKLIAARVAAGVTVRLIVSADYAEKWGEKMKAQGVDLTANLYTQPSVHNKGFVVDSQTVVVSSQNFSPSGVETNRDAGVIIANSDIAQYFEKVFLADFNNKSKPFVAKGAAPSKGRPGKAKPGPKKKGPKKAPPKKPVHKKAAKKQPAKKKARGKK